MTAPIGVTSARRDDAADQQDAQDLFGGVGHRRERVGRQDRETGDAREPLVVCEVRGDGCADEHALELRKEAFRQANLQPAGGVS